MTQDARVALAYAPQRDGACAWPAAHALHSNILEALVENTQACLVRASGPLIRSTCVDHGLLQTASGKLLPGAWLPM